MKSEVYVVDISALEEGVLPDLISEGTVKGRILVHRVILKEIEKKAREGDPSGILGLKALREAAEKANIKLEYVGNSSEDIEHAIYYLAEKEHGIIISSDVVMIKMAEAMGIKTLYRRFKPGFKLEDFFDGEVMSVHLKEGLPPHVKRGKPGSWRYEPVGEKPLTRRELEALVRDIMEEVEKSGDGFVEIRRDRSIIIQLNTYRIVVTKPPLSDGMEVTAVKPIIKLSLEDYNLPRKLMKRLEEQAEGILIAGPPGMGKTTFAQALAEFYSSMGQVVKTIESPRDMVLPPEVTQYSKTAGSLKEIYDVLLLSRPNYTVFDEMRNATDFKLYADLRLAGVGMIGVVHATTPMDAIQRFIDKVELGLIPSIIDTVIFIEKGHISKVYALETTVKIPHGLAEKSLARPTIVIKNFMTGEPEFELYVFGKRTFVVPLKSRRNRVEEAVDSFLSRYIPEYRIEIVEGEAIIFIPPAYMPSLSRNRMRKLDKLVRRFGLHLRIEPEI